VSRVLFYYFPISGENNWVYKFKIILISKCVRFSETRKQRWSNHTDYRPWKAQRVTRGWGSQISRQSAHKRGKVFSPPYRPPLPQEIFLVLISARGRVDPMAIVQQEGLRQWKKIQWHHRESNPRPSGWYRSALPSAPPRSHERKMCYLKMK